MCKSKNLLPSIYREGLGVGLLLFALGAHAEKIALSTPGTTLVIDVAKGSEPSFVYYGAKLSMDEIKSMPAPTTANWSHLHLYPAYGATHCESEVAFAMRHFDGNLSTQFLTTDYKLEPITDEAPNGAMRHGNRITITLQDPLYPDVAHLYYQSYDDVDMIECWTDFTNNEKGTVTLTQFYSTCMPIRRGNVHATHFSGTWAAEAQMVVDRLQGGTLMLKNKDGMRNAHTERNEIMFSLDGYPSETCGDVIGTSLLYSGNYRTIVETDASEYHYFFSGINPDNSEYHLSKGQTFTTPHVAYTFSHEGTSGASRNFHRWARKYQLRHGDKERDILLNSWEGVYFDINQQGMDQMMHDIASMGGELFVMDDGWFGDKYPRKNDSSSLGDWVVDKNKLPDGIEGLIRDAKKNGVKFGIWIEPEMANTTSELYEAHPDWIIKAPGREPVLGRGGTQVVLDLSNPRVQDFVFGVFDNLLTKYPEIAYIKWDANAPVMNHGSQYLTMDNQSHLYIALHDGLLNVLKRIRAKYPDVVVQDCASGGGRVNYGMLPYFDEFWVSDDTDALQRIYMQWGTSYFYPAIAQASHISAAPNHQTGRVVSIKFRADVAMSGRLGMEIQPKNMTDEEKNICRQAINDYKRIRPIVQFGDQYRLHSPYAGDNLASLMYVTEKKDRAVFYWYKLETFVNEHLPRVKMQGLDPDRRYRVNELNRIDNNALPFEGQTFTGHYLMTVGLEMPASHSTSYGGQNDWASRVLLLEMQ